MSARSRPLSGVPLKDRATCEQCGEVVDTKASGIGEIVHGVAVNRQQGGANVITLMERQRRWLCRVCIDMRKRGHRWQQLDLFDGAE